MGGAAECSVLRCAAGSLRLLTPCYALQAPAYPPCLPCPHPPALPCSQESTAGGQQQPGSDWFQEQAAAAGGSGAPWESAYASLQTAAAILQWVVTEAEVRRQLGKGRPRWQ